MTVLLPLPVVVTRYKCPTCGRTHSSKSLAVRHIGRCWQNPDAHGCKTCKHYEPGTSGDWEIGDPGSEEACGKGVAMDGSAACEACGGIGDVWEGVEPEARHVPCQTCNGTGGTNGPIRKAGPRVHCDKWAAEFGNSANATEAQS